MQGSTYSGAAALITAADPGELIQRAALLEAAGGHRSDVVDRVTVLQQQATAADEAARTTLAEAATLKEQATAALQVAQDAEISARAQAAELGTQQAQLQTELAAAQQQLTALIGERAAAAARRRGGAAGAQARARPRRRRATRPPPDPVRRLGRPDRDRRGHGLPRHRPTRGAAAAPAAPGRAWTPTRASSASTAAG